MMSSEPAPKSNPTVAAHVHRPSRATASTTQEDIFAAALSLEDTSYNEGYELGFADGSRAGRIEGRAFGLQKGFEKFVDMGRLHGRACVWGARTPGLKATKEGQQDEDRLKASEDSLALSQLASNPRLKKHIVTLFALTESAQMTTQNNEEAVSEFDDRLKRATAKLKVVEKIVGELPVDEESLTTTSPGQPQRQSVRLAGTRPQDGNIEDFTIPRGARQ